VLGGDALDDDDGSGLDDDDDGHRRSLTSVSGVDDLRNILSSGSWRWRLRVLGGDSLDDDDLRNCLRRSSLSVSKMTWGRFYENLYRSKNFRIHFYPEFRTNLHPGTRDRCVSEILH
jgi:hypothetical protein